MGREPEERRETVAALPSASHASSVQDVPNMPPHGDIVSLMSRTLGAANRYLVELMARGASDRCGPRPGVGHGSRVPYAYHNADK